MENVDFASGFKPFGWRCVKLDKKDKIIPPPGSDLSIFLEILRYWVIGASVVAFIGWLLW
jgi:hypothetical protein